MATLNDLLIAVCEYYGADIEKVRSKNRKGESIAARRMYCFLAKKYFYKKYNDDKSLRIIGKQINKDHATVLYHFGIQEGFNDIYPNIKQEMIDIMESLRKGHYETDISKRYCTAMGYLGLAYVFNMEVDF